MTIYAIEKDLNHLLLVDKDLMVVNGNYQLNRNEDGTLFRSGMTWKAYYVMRVEVSKNFSYNAVLEEAREFLENQEEYNLMQSGG